MSNPLLYIYFILFNAYKLGGPIGKEIWIPYLIKCPCHWLFTCMQTNQTHTKKWKSLNLSNIIHLLPWLKTRAQKASLLFIWEKKIKTKQEKNPTPSITLHLLRLILQQLLVVLIWRGSLWPRFNGQRNTYRKGIKSAILIPLWKLALEMRPLVSKRRAKRGIGTDNSYLYTKLLWFHSSSQPGQLPRGTLLALCAK